MLQSEDNLSAPAHRLNILGAVSLLQLCISRHAGLSQPQLIGALLPMMPVLHCVQHSVADLTLLDAPLLCVCPAGALLLWLAAILRFAFRLLSGGLQCHIPLT